MHSKFSTYNPTSQKPEFLGRWIMRAVEGYGG